MNIFRSRLAVTAAVSILVVGAASAALAQDPNLEKASSSTQAAVSTPDEPVGGPNGSGTARTSTWIAASKFAVRLNSSAPQLTYSSWHYYSSPGSASPEGYFAHVDLEPGALMDMFTCVYNDGSVTNNVSYSLQKYTSDLTAHTRSGTTLASGASTGSAGLSFQNVPITPNETLHTLVNNTLIAYYIRMDVAADTSFAGCWVFWRRQVSPSPGVATFADVPLSDGRNKFVEALFSSGVTVGCGGGNFCPDTPVTRGQMAVFLSAALGLNWQN